MKFNYGVIASSVPFLLTFSHSFTPQLPPTTTINNYYQFKSRQRSLRIKLNSSVSASDTVNIRPGLLRSTKKKTKLLPPLFSDVLAMLPFSDMSASVLIRKLMGKRGGVSSKVSSLLLVLSRVLFGFPVLFKAWTFIFWPLHVSLMHNFGVAKAMFVTSTLGLAFVQPLTIMMMIPFVTPMASEFKPEAVKNFKRVRASLISWQTVRIFAIAFILFPLTILGSCPAPLLQSTATPSFSYLTLVQTALAYTLAMEATYYYPHRLMHWTKHNNNPVMKWLNKIHRIHHGSHGDQLIPIDSIRLHSFELIATVLSIMSGPMLFRQHPAMSLFFAAYNTATAIISHTMYFELDYGHHTMHHQRSNCNYGLCGILDNIHQTERVPSVERFFKIAAFHRNSYKTITVGELSDMKGHLTTSLTSRNFQPGEAIVHIGDEASSFFILEEGSCVALLPDDNGMEQVVKTYDDSGDYFGERALLRGEPRAATIRAGEFGAKVAEIPKEEFSLLSDITNKFEEQLSKYDKESLPSTTAGIKLLDQEVRTYSALMPQETYDAGQTIIRQGERGDVMYILEEGDCLAYVDGVEVATYSDAGDYFGELALLNQEPRKASIVAGTAGAVVAVVTRSVFDKLVAEEGGESAIRQQAIKRYRIGSQANILGDY